jgi:PAS domain S-box-containing protein
LKRTTPSTREPLGVPRDPAKEREKILLAEIEWLRTQLVEPEATLAAIRSGEVDAFVVSESTGERVYALRSADPPYRLIVEEMQEGAGTLSGDGTILYANRRLADLIGVPVERLRGQSFLDFVSPEESASFRAVLEGPEVGRAELKLLKTDGESFCALVAASAMLQDGLAVHSLIVTDLTEQKRQMAQEAVSAATQEADRRKDEFLALLSHELRNPLAAITNAVQVLEQSAASPERVQWARQLIDRQTRHLTRMVDDLLDVSRIAIGKIELRMERVDLAMLLRRVVDAHRDQFEERRRFLSLVLPEEGTMHVHGDPDRLAQVVANLLDNALKYTGENARIWVILSESQGRAQLCVGDSGAGIPADMLGRIFEQFTQVDPARTPARGGLGLGLTLVRKLAELHEGSVEARSEGPGRGSEFIVSLPLLPRAQESPAPPAEKTDPSARRPQRILVVEDHRDSAEGLATLLRMAGHDVTTVGDGPAAIACCRSVRPETVLLDIGLPGMDGYEVARRLRELLGGDLLIVALTGYGQERDRQRSVESGIDHHVLKPFQAEAITDLLDGKAGKTPRRAPGPGPAAARP